MSHVTFLFICKTCLNLNVHDFTQGSQHIIDCEPASPAEVVNLTLFAFLRSEYRTTDNVIYICEIPCLIAVFKNSNAALFQSGKNKTVKPHIRTLPRPINGKV